VKTAVVLERNADRKKHPGRRFALEAKKEPQPELHIHADKMVHYERVAQVMADAAKTGWCASALSRSRC